MAIYFVRIGSAGLVKIGLATDVAKRLGQLQVGIPERLHLLRLLAGGRAEEAAIHRRFAAGRVRGEWFQFSGEMLTADFGLAEGRLPDRAMPYNAVRMLELGDAIRALPSKDRPNQVRHMLDLCIGYLDRNSNLVPLSRDEFAARMGVPAKRATEAAAVLARLGAITREPRTVRGRKTTGVQYRVAADLAGKAARDGDCGTPPLTRDKGI